MAEISLLIISLIIGLTAVFGKTRPESKKVVASPTWIGWIVIIILTLSTAIGIYVSQQHKIITNGQLEMAENSLKLLKDQIEAAKRNTNQLLLRVDRAETLATFFAVSQADVTPGVKLNINLQKHVSFNVDFSLSKNFLIKNEIKTLEHVLLPKSDMKYSEIIINMGLMGLHPSMPILKFVCDGKKIDKKRELYAKTDINHLDFGNISLNNNGHQLSILASGIGPNVKNKFSAGRALKKYHLNYVEIKISGLGTEDNAQKVKLHLEQLLGTGEIRSLSDEANLFSIIVPLKIYKVGGFWDSVSVGFQAANVPRIELLPSREKKDIDNSNGLQTNDYTSN